MYDMTLKELSETLEHKKKALGYKLWKQADLIRISVIDALRDKKSKSIFPSTPQNACPELYPPKPSLKITTKLSKKYNERSW